MPSKKLYLYRPLRKPERIGLIGNFLKNYDLTLFGLLAPYLAPAFFPNSSPVTALIYTYALLPLGLITKPLGAFVFGRIGDRSGRKRALFFSLSGIAAVNMATGLLPGADTLGSFAPFLLGIARMLQSFFAAGEAAGGALLLLENTEKEKQTRASSLYDMSSIGGILFASFGIGILSFLGIEENGWRFLFLTGGLTGIVGLFFRKQAEIPESTPLASRPSPLSSIKDRFEAFVSIMFASGFSHVTFSLSFTFMNGFVPLVSDVTRSQVASLNILLLCFDFLLLPVFGRVAEKIGKETLMLVASLCCALLAPILFFFLPGSGLIGITLIRLLLITPGVAFAAPYYAWAKDLAPNGNRYLFLALGSALGHQLIGSPCSAVSLWLYDLTGLSFVPGLYLTLFGGGIGFLLYRQNRSSVSSETRHS